MKEVKEGFDWSSEDILCHGHMVASLCAAIRPDGFELDDDARIHIIERHFREIMKALGLDMTDDSLKDTPGRVAKMYVKEIFSGLNPANKPAITLFDNKYSYDQMVVEKDISVYSNCEHHFVPIVGRAHVAYISKGKVIGLSKLNRIVQYCSRRPQVQERLTMDVARMLEEALNTADVAVMIDANHHCVASRGVRDEGSSTVTACYMGRFAEADTKNEFLRFAGV